MGGSANILNNTILIPSHDSLVKANPLPTYNAAKKLPRVDVSQVNDTHFEYGAYIKIKDGPSAKIQSVQEITGFGMERVNEQRPTSSGNYVVNLPGPVTYSDVTIKHLFTKDKFFLDWVMNGVTQGGAARTDMELHFKVPLRKSNNKVYKHIVFTLYDAFPTRWKIDELAVTGGEVLIEEIIVTYSGLRYRSTIE